MITLDFETRSFVELSGKTGVGTWSYSQHPTTAILCMAYKIDDNPTQIWAPWADDLEYLRTVDAAGAPKGGCPIDLVARIAAGDQLVAHNAFFERAMWENILVPAGWPEIKPEQWVCTMAMAQAAGLPGSLDKAVKLLDLPVKKGDQKYMRRMMKPRSMWRRTGKGDIWFGTEGDYRGLCEYCILDVDVEHQLYNAILKLSPRERKIWLLDQEINHRGVRIDRPLAEGVWSVFSSRRGAKAAQLVDITGGEVTKPSETAKIVKWVSSHGVRMADCTADTVKELLSRDDIDQRIRDVLEIRSAVGGSAALKFDAFLRHCNLDDRLRGAMVYWGAHTGRWTSKGVQLHNASKNKMDVDEAEAYIPCFYEPSPDRILASLRERGLPLDKLDDLIATLVRSVLTPDEGCVFVDFDYAAIEARVVAWLAGEEELIEDFRAGTPVYEKMAAEIFGIPLSQVTKGQRALGKVAILGLGYGMGAGKFYETCLSWGVSGVTPELAERAKTIYRSKYVKIQRYWYEFEDHLRRSILTGRKSKFKSAQISYKSGVLMYTLPNGRKLHYRNCRIEDGSIKYFGRLPPPKSGYGDVYSWGGKFTENQDQALSRDYMALAMRRVNAIEGVDVLLTIHDEILMQVKENELDKLLPVIQTEIKPLPLWATGLPIDTSYWVGKRFRKD